MIKFTLSLTAWGSERFTTTLKQEICRLDTRTLPLQQGLQYSSVANAENLSAIILNISEDSATIIVSAGLFYHGIIAGCNCADDPTPVDENNEYCEVLFRIDKTTALTTVALID